MESKSVILFIFEGVTEKIALENILKKIFSSNHVDVEFIGTDITSDNNISRADIEVYDLPKTEGDTGHNACKLYLV